MLLVVVGDLDVEQLKGRITAAFQRFPVEITR